MEIKPYIKKYIFKYDKNYKEKLPKEFYIMEYWQILQNNLERKTKKKIAMAYELTTFPDEKKNTKLNMMKF